MNVKQTIFLVLLLLIVGLFVLGCKQQTAECTKNTACIITGCSSEVCSNKQVMTPCIIKPGYECLKYADCGCINNKCQWIFNDKYNECMKEVSNIINK